VPIMLQQIPRAALHVGALTLAVCVSACGGREIYVYPDAGPLPDASLGDAHVVPACENGVRDGVETAIDCGGAECAPCEEGRHCLDGDDCEGGVCLRGFCLAPTCTDEVRNGDETGVDCGAECGLCPAGEPCSSNTECISRRCGAGAVCAAATCSDGIENDLETAIDCGGTACPACDADFACVVADDCTSGRCVGGICQAASCTDRVRNQDESSIDCGGITCPRCRDGFTCVLGSDCMSSECTDGRCGS
jgi:hypothetical protein